MRLETLIEAGKQVECSQSIPSEFEVLVKHGFQVAMEHLTMAFHKNLTFQWEECSSLFSSQLPPAKQDHNKATINNDATPSSNAILNQHQ